MGLYRIGGFLKNKKIHKHLYDLNDWKYSHICIRKLSNTSMDKKSSGQKLVNSNKPSNFACFSNIIKDLTEYTEVDLTETKEWFTNVLKYNVEHGMAYKKVTLVDLYKLLEEDDKISEENVQFAWLLWWCTRMLHSSVTIIDDIIDNTETRNGIPCWYKLEDVGLRAASDAQTIYSSIFSLLRKHISTLPYYIHVLDVFHKVMSQTYKGQFLDLHSHVKNVGLDGFTMDRHKTIVKYKNASFFHLPMSLALYMTGKFDEELHNDSHSILSDLCYFFQVQNDFEDIYGDPKVTGKIGNDISEGKCSWLAVKAVQKASLRQRKVLEDNIGVPKQSSVDAVKNVYEELDLQSDYFEFRERSYINIGKKIEDNSNDISTEVFYEFRKEIYLE